jgi:Domain of unknown function (DUF1854).
MTNQAPRSEGDIDLINWLDPKVLNFRLEGSMNSISMTIKGERSFARVFTASAFPQSAPDEFIQFYDSKLDGTRGAMIGMLRNLSGLAPEDRAAVKESLRRSYLVPRVIHIRSVSDRGDITHWDLDTDRGRRQFDMIQPHRNVQSFGRGAIMLIDLEENRYEIPSIQRLDRHSRHLLERFI